MAGIADTLNPLALAADQALNPGRLPGGDGSRQMGFVILAFPLGDIKGRRCHYISNCGDRAEIASLLREQAAYFEGMPDGLSGRA